MYKVNRKNATYITCSARKIGLVCFFLPNLCLCVVLMPVTWPSVLLIIILHPYFSLDFTLQFTSPPHCLSKPFAQFRALLVIPVLFKSRRTYLLNEMWAFSVLSIFPLKVIIIFVFFINSFYQQYEELSLGGF